MDLISTESSDVESELLRPGSSAWPQRLPSRWLAAVAAAGAGAAVLGIVAAAGSRGHAAAGPVPRTAGLSGATGLWEGDGTTGAASGASAQALRKGSFLVIGDWGYDFGCHGGSVVDVQCQQAVADKMLQTMKELGDVKFVINVGDSFYPHGVVNKQDPQWQTKWRNVFDKSVRSVPWYSVYGNHDYQHDPCACSETPEACAQVSANISDLDYFYMPDVSWYKGHPELGLEVVALELNHFMEGWAQDRGSEEQFFDDCKYTACPELCKANAKRRADEAFKLYYDRTSRTDAKNLVVFSHYPTDYFHSKPDFLASLSDASKHKVLYFGGHRHNIDQTSTTSIAPNDNWLVGGGGGWSCDGPSQGFLVVEVSATDELKSYPVLVPNEICCQSPTPSRWKPTPSGNDCWWLGCDNCIDPAFCDCRAANPDGPCTACPNMTSRHVVCSGSDCGQWAPASMLKRK